MATLTHRWRFVAMVLAALTISVRLSVASHFRGITLNYKPQDATGKVEICHMIAWKWKSSEGRCTADDVANGNEAGEDRQFQCEEVPSASSGCPTPRDKLGTMKYVCRNFLSTSGDDTRDWSIGDNCFERTFDLQETTKFYVKDGVPCCWIGLVNVVSLDIEARLTMDLSIRPDLVARNRTVPINTSPQTVLRPVVRTRVGCTFQYKIIAFDADGDAIRCRYAVLQEDCGGVCGALETAGAQLDTDSCTIDWTPGMGLRGFHVAAVLIEDFDRNNQRLSSVPLQFLIDVFDSGSQDCSTPVVSPAGGSCIVIPPSDSYSLVISAVQVGNLSSDEIEQILILSAPDGMVTGRLQRVGNSTTWQRTVSWTPMVADYGSHLFCYLATDRNGVQSPRECLTLLAGVVADVLPSIQKVAPRSSLPHPPELTIQFTAEVAVSSQLKSISIFEFDTDVEVEVIPTSSVSQVMLLDGNLRANVTLNNTLVPNRKYYVLIEDGAFVAMQYCAGVRSPVAGISDKTNWTFIAEGAPDADECADSTLNNCHQFATCVNQNPSFICVCRSGFTGNGVDCEDMDECDTGIHDCHANANCTNTIGDFTCSCKDGFTGDGKLQCDDVNECTLNPNSCHANADCLNNEGSFECKCKVGFDGDGVMQCADTDECTRGNGSDPCALNANCTNTLGSYSCQCRRGYAGNGTVRCDDIDECSENLDDCDVTLTDCHNTDGSFECRCRPGFSGNGQTCDDVDECSTGQHTCDENADCANTLGSFQCTCKLAYTGDGFTCVDIGNCTDQWPIVRDRHLSQGEDWQNLTTNCPAANLTELPVNSNDPPIKQWRVLLDQFMKNYEAWLATVRNLISGVPTLPVIDSDATPEEVWDILHSTHEQAQKAWQEQVGDPNDITFPDPFADCKDVRQRQWVISSGTTRESMEEYREVFGDECHA